MIDVHCHYLPAVDDGAQDLQSALRLLRLARADGVRKLVLTPHVHAGRWDNSLGFLLPRFDAFRNLVASKNIDVELYLGAEVHLLPESLRLLNEGQIPFIGGWDGMKVMLLELPGGGIPPNALAAVRYLVGQGVLPMVAHPERNKTVMADVSSLEPFVEEGCLLQLTAASVIGEFGSRVYRTAQAILKKGWAGVVASDAHNASHRRTRMKAAFRFLRKHYGETVAERLLVSSPERLLNERQTLCMDTMARLEAVRW